MYFAISSIIILDPSYIYYALGWNSKVPIAQFNTSHPNFHISFAFSNEKSS